MSSPYIGSFAPLERPPFFRELYCVRSTLGSYVHQCLISCQHSLFIGLVANYCPPTLLSYVLLFIFLRGLLNVVREHICECCRPDNPRKALRLTKIYTLTHSSIQTMRHGRDIPLHGACCFLTEDACSQMLSETNKRHRADTARRSDTSSTNLEGTNRCHILSRSQLSRPDRQGGANPDLSGAVEGHWRR